jgi:hypothetical protein
MRVPRPGARTARLALGHAWRRVWPCVTPAIVTLWRSHPGCACSPSLTGARASLEELLVGKRIVGLAAIAEDDVIDDVDAEELSGVHQALC